MASDTRVLQVKVTLKGAKPPIWRRLLVESQTPLSSFHDILQTAMGWYDCHLHEFESGGIAFGPPDPEAEPGLRDEAAVRLGSLLKSPGDQLSYLYDFGDGWHHEVLLEKKVAREPGREYPWVLAGRRACPREDSGGVYGYAAVLEILSNPAHPEHAETVDWLGVEHDPARFDPAEVNALLHPG